MQKMRTIITPIKHSLQRYPSVGDYLYEGDDIRRIYVSDTGDERMNDLIALHEFVESVLCAHRGIPEPVILEFDKANPDLDDPGRDKRAPYRREHVFAENIERLMAEELGVDWDEYGKRLDAL
jgi:hypothetical protein